MTTPPLGRLQRVPLRDAWEKEDQHFTPWLAEERNLALLAETIGIDLELEAQEKNVGPFKADILCKDTVNDHWVLVENQLDRTDHIHLGQLLTYAAGLDAVTIVWIAERFTDEHRAALDWLNEITDDRADFFGLEVELWRIGDSPIAPKFNIVCKPNEWSKAVGSAARSGDISETKLMQQQFWEGLADHLRERDSPLRPQKPLPQHWTNFAIGRAHFWLQAVQNTREGLVRASVNMSGPVGKVHYELLHQDREAIEGDLQEPPIWNELPDAKESRIELEWRGVDPLDREQWPKLIEWLADKLELLDRVFRGRVKELDVSAYDAPTEDEPVLST